MQGGTEQEQAVTHLVDYILEIGLFTVKLVYGENHRFFKLLCCAEYILRADFHTILGIDKDYTCICYVQRRDGISDEIVCSGTIYDIKLFVVPLGVKYSGEY